MPADVTLIYTFEGSLLYKLYQRKEIIHVYSKLYVSVLILTSEYQDI